MKVKTPEPEGFHDFWAAWMPLRRKNDGRGDAREAYRKQLLRGAEPADILDGAKAYLRSLTDRDKSYIPLAATWLNREAYADWCEQERQFQARLAEIQERKDNVVPMAVRPVKSKWLTEYEARQRGALKQAE